LISIDFKKIRSTKDKLLRFLKKNNIFCQYHYIPIYKFKLFNQKINLNNYKGAEFYYKNTISLPIFYDLNINFQKKIINKIKIFLNK
jgi:dTDP-4-amino-4,6-dideoxygalactose transaminase